jgi:hypothetical protein
MFTRNTCDATIQPTRCRTPMTKLSIFITLPTATYSSAIHRERTVASPRNTGYTNASQRIAIPAVTISPNSTTARIFKTHSSNFFFQQPHLSCSYPCTDFTTLRKNPTNVLINVNTTSCTLPHFYMFQTSRWHNQGVLTHFMNRVNKMRDQM